MIDSNDYYNEDVGSDNIDDDSDNEYAAVVTCNKYNNTSTKDWGTKDAPHRTRNWKRKNSQPMRSRLGRMLQAVEYIKKMRPKGLHA